VKTDHRVIAPINRRHDGAGGAVIDAEQHGILLGTDEESMGCAPATVTRGGKVSSRALADPAQPPLSRGLVSAPLFGTAPGA
jgi:hypothetical protein